MPDEDEFDFGADEQARIEDALLVDTLMGWDGDPCRCVECACPRFLDGLDDALCGPCLVGDRWRANG